MSGHSKWSSIKHKKAAADAKRGKQFTRLIREIMLAARNGGGNPESNPSLRMAIERARESNMPADNIKRAIQKGTGEGGTVQLEEVSYEGYGPGGVAIKVEVVTDNKRRSAGEVRAVFNKYNGSLGEVGCVSWNFERRGRIAVSRDAAGEDKLLEAALEAGAEDMVAEDEVFAVYTQPESVGSVREKLEQDGIGTLSGEFLLVPKSTVQVAGKDAEGLLKLLDALEELDDVQSVAANFEMPDELMEQLEAA